ncbi:hypothetical protein HDU77_010384 [Chytriomyces hyalinus]|nr:hypothetical protein HDU77_010384 [Chytriomyces hyalinus]
MPTTTCMQWLFQAAQPQHALHRDLSSQDLFHNLHITYGHFLTHDFVLLPRTDQDDSSPQVSMHDLYSDNASLTPLMFPELLDSHASDRSHTTTTSIPQMMSDVTNSWTEDEDFVPDESEFDGIRAINDRPFMCQGLEPTCSEAFNSLQELLQHEAVAHTVVPTLHGPSAASSRPIVVVACFNPVRNMIVYECTFEGCDKAYATRNRAMAQVLAGRPHTEPLGRGQVKKGTIEGAACLEKYKTLKRYGARHDCHGAKM